MNAGKPTGVIGRQPTSYSIAATRTRYVSHVPGAAVDSTLLLNSSPHKVRILHMLTEFKVIDVKCIDDSSKTRGISILCTPTPPPFKGVQLIFDKATPHKQTDELAALLLKMKLTEILAES